MSDGYDVQQVVYLISNKKQQVYPVQIAEKIRKLTVEGEETKYRVKVPFPQYNSQLYDLDDLDGEIYSSIEEVRTVLMNKISQHVENIVKNAEKTSDEFFNNGSKNDFILKNNTVKKQPVDDSSKKNVQKQAKKEEDNLIVDDEGRPLFKIGNITGI